MLEQLSREGMVIIDDALPAFMFGRLAEIVLSNTFPWKRGSTVDKDDPYMSFGHKVDLGADDRIAEVTFNSFLAIIERAGLSGDINLIRARFNCLTREADTVRGVPHIDQSTPHIVAVLYLQDSDGDTVFYSGNKSSLTEWKSISPKANRLVLFNGCIYHSATSPVTNQMRLVANYNFTLQH